VTTPSFLLLICAGVAAGLSGAVAGLASLFSYPALLTFGLSPVSANVTNTTALLSSTVGSAIGARRDLRGQGRRCVVLCLQAAFGGALGALLLLRAPAGAFEAVVPWLIALGSLLLLTRESIRRGAIRWRKRIGRPAHVTRTKILWAAVIVLVGIYGGYFGAAAGIMMLAANSLQADEPLAVTNAVKNLATGAANGVAALAYMVFGDVDWAAALALAIGCGLGGWIGPGVVRFMPERPLRVAIALAGLGLAVHLWSRT
jgi:uncharacterized protein